jgi:NADH-dependent peroxiredoxin subunit F
MLTPDIIQALKIYTAKMDNAINLVVNTGEHPKRAELLTFLNGIAEVTEKIALEERATETLRSPISFLIESIDTNGVATDTGIRFSGIPGGHEFSSLILAMLQSSGTALKLEMTLQKMIQKISEPLNFEVFISLSCHNCPDVVQTLNQFALLNENISSEMIDGGPFQEIINERDIQGVPSVYLNGELFANGKVTASELIEKLIERDNSITELEDAEQMPLQDVTIIGGGPAGASAAIYSARKGLKVTLIADRMGGQVKDTMDIENLISVPKTTGPELTGALQTHMDEYEITTKEHLKVTEVIKNGPGGVKQVVLSSGEIIDTKTVIIATGAKWRELGVPGEKENIGNGVAYCPHCDGPFFKGKDIAVIGGGNSGIEAALDLSGIVKSVTVFEFNPTLKADQVLVDKANAKANIKILTNVATKQILATDGKVTGIEYTDREDNSVNQIELAGVFVQIGLLPNSSFLSDTVKLSQYGEIEINEKCETSEPGIYACGDVTTVPYKQIVISMGEGSKASLASFEYLLSHSDDLEQAYEQAHSEQPVEKEQQAA